MPAKYRLPFATCCVFTAVVMLPVCAAAADDGQVERLQRQIDAMQQQMQRQQQQFQQQLSELKRQLNETKKSRENAKIASSEYAKAPTANAPWPAPGVKVTLGGFVEAGCIWRQRNEVSDIGHPGFSTLPSQLAPLSRARVPLQRTAESADFAGRWGH